MSTLVNLMVLNANLTGFSFSTQNLLSILTSFEINLYPSPPPKIIEKSYNYKYNRVFPIIIFAKSSILEVWHGSEYTNTDSQRGF